MPGMVGHSPYTPSTTGATGFVSYRVNDCRNAWINWGKTYKYIK
jgi:hypothetical protein